ncbi:uncharacterized protein [Nicotiana sylvestris]|uniref:uncharacterized protein n=1 Tax=Nicotiana sylvestris TaxID=4096 RepID=UPI00388C36B6
MGLKHGKQQRVKIARKEEWIDIRGCLDEEMTTEGPIYRKEGQNIICDGPHVPMKKLGKTGPMVLKDRKEYSDIDRKSVEKNYREKKILVCGIGPDEHNRVSACDSAKEIWEALQTAHEETTQVKQSKIDMLTTKYEFFRMKDDESIQDMHTRFTSIINDLHSIGDVIPINKLVRNILSVLPGSW